MRHTALLWVGVVVITTVISGCSKESTKPTSAEPGARAGAVGTGGAGANVSSDEDFVRSVAMKTMAGIELSRIALQVATRADIKSFAQGLIDDHRAAGTKLKGALSVKPGVWADQLDEKHREIVDELGKKRGTDFDRAYLKAVIDSHQDLAAVLESRIDVQSLAEWKTAAAARTQTGAMPDPTIAMRDVAVRPDKSGNESTLKINQWAADTYPDVQKHLDTARSLENTGRNL
jgi:putative membrane protein